jgi:glucose-1-phosphate cytidylyltransferase
MVRTRLLGINRFLKSFLNTVRYPRGMQVVILCGGKGSRLSEHTQSIPKPMIEIGDKPILMHLMEFYAGYGHKDFLLCLGYKGEKIKEFFKDNKKWNIEFVDTGEDSNKAERMTKIKDRIKDDTFIVSYGDDLCDVDINELIEFHNTKNKIVTLTAVPMMSPFGILQLDENNEVINIEEKPRLKNLMNGGFYVMKKKIFDYIKPGYDLEKEVFDDLARDKQIAALKHEGFWKSMNTLKDAIELNELHKKGNTPWIR